jgi:hypothetical protein
VKKWSEVVQLDKIAVELEAISHHPDHTYHLRSLATQVASGIHVDLASQVMRDLLADESALDDKQRDALYRVILGALS